MKRSNTFLLSSLFILLIGLCLSDLSTKAQKVSDSVIIGNSYKYVLKESKYYVTKVKLKKDSVAIKGKFKVKIGGKKKIKKNIKLKVSKKCKYYIGEGEDSALVRVSRRRVKSYLDTMNFPCACFIVRKNKVVRIELVS